MKSSLALLLCVLLLSAREPEPYRQALPGYQFSFPRDHFDHPEFRTEWWYYTGNLRDTTGRRFGFELTFFRHAVQPQLRQDANVWDVRDVWMAHFALSDINGKRFFNTERLNRSGAGLAGVDARQGRIWNGNWSMQWTGETQKLNAVAESFRIDLTMRSAKPPVTHGANGVSQKSAGAGRASHYVSLTRLFTSGAITLDGRKYEVEGLSWMDHEFFSNSLEANQSGWDWFSLQFDDGSELMLYRLRRKDGTVEPYSSGTYIDASGRTKHLRLQDFQLEPGQTWTSADTGAKYPIRWKVRVLPLSLDLAVSTRMPQQELASKSAGLNTYWEGAIEISGTRGGKPIRGAGYLEMTGYAGSVQMGR
jgi:predicted secreted hydrolase